MQRKIILTEDGSATIQLSELNEQYHSIHGAIAESMHVYIQTGLQYLVEKEKITILEIGFGTGLNTLLTFLYGQEQKIEYHGIEAYPITPEEMAALNYVEKLQAPDISDAMLRNVFESIHKAHSGSPVKVTERFTFKKNIETIETITLPDNFYDLVYFDAFSPVVQPELWHENIFQKIIKSMAKGGILTTYCAKGAVKRTLRSTGFEIENLPGPAGKREITRAIKINN